MSPNLVYLVHKPAEKIHSAQENVVFLNALYLHALIALSRTLTSIERAGQSVHPVGVLLL